MHEPAHKDDGRDGLVADHVAWSQIMWQPETEGLDVGAVLSEACHSCTVQQSAALQVDNVKMSAVRENITKHCNKSMDNDYCTFDGYKHIFIKALPQTTNQQKQNKNNNSKKKPSSFNFLQADLVACTYHTIQ